MGQIIDLLVPRCLDEYITITKCKTDKAKKIKDWKRRYPREVRQQVIELLNMGKASERSNLYRKTVRWLRKSRWGADHK